MKTATRLTTEALNVAGVEVVELRPDGKAFMGPFYADQLDLLRKTISTMPRRNEFVVWGDEVSNWIYRR